MEFMRLLEHRSPITDRQAPAGMIKPRNRRLNQVLVGGRSLQAQTLIQLPAGLSRGGQQAGGTLGKFQRFDIGQRWNYQHDARSIDIEPAQPDVTTPDLFYL